MRIGILTLPLHTNYGGILQAYALQAILQRMGHDVEVINTDRKPYKYGLRPVTITFIKRILRRIFKGQHYDYYNINTPAQISYNIFLNRTKYTNEFVRKHIHQYIVKNHVSDIHQQDFDTIIVGSDQVWRNWYIPDIKIFFLTFAKDWRIKKIAYAVSFGTDKLDYGDNLIECKEGLKTFSHISCREIDGIKICKDVFNRDADFVLDPTLLLHKDDYQKLYSSPHKVDILSYIMDRSEEAREIEKHIGKTTNGEITIVNSRAEDASLPIEKRNVPQPPVENWLSAFDSCRMVITDSFHACVFSIIYNKPFWIIGNKERGMSRFHSLLETFNLTNRLIDVSFYDDINLYDEINWNQVNSIWQEKRKESMEFLTNALKS